MADLNIEEMYIANPSTTIGVNDLLYVGKSPYGTINDSAIIGSDLLAQIIAENSGRPSALYASTTGIAGTYDNGTAGVGATFTVTATGIFHIDGSGGFSIGDIIFLKNQGSVNGNPLENGLWVVTNPGAVGVQAEFVRHPSYNSSALITEGSVIFVVSGTVKNAGTSWIMNNAGPITVGTDPITYQQTEAAQNLDGAALLNTSDTNFFQAGAQVYGPAQLTSTAGEIAVDGYRSIIFKHTLTENTVLKNPNNLTSCTLYYFIITQAATPFTLALESWYTPLGDAFVMPTTPGAVVILQAMWDEPKMFYTFSSPTATSINTITGDTGGAIAPTAGNINLVGVGMTISGDGDTLTFTTGAESTNAPPNYITGGQFSWAAGSPGQITIAPVICMDSTNTYQINSASPINFTSSNLDTGSWTAGARYYAFICDNPTTPSPIIVVSLSNTTPDLTGHAGYTKFRYVGYVQSDSRGSLAIDGFIQEGNSTRRDTTYVSSDSTKLSVLTSGAATSPAQVFCTGCISANATHAKIKFQLASAVTILSIFTSLNTSVAIGVFCGASVGTLMQNVFDVPLDSSQTFYYSVSGASAAASMQVAGFTESL